MQSNVFDKEIYFMVRIQFENNYVPVVNNTIAFIQQNSAAST